MKNDFSDLRFTYFNNTTQSETEIQDFCLGRDCPGVDLNNYATVDGVYTDLWIKIPTLPPSTVTTLYMYYGNASAVSLSDKSKAFLYYADFESCFAGAISCELFANQTAGSSNNDGVVIFSNGKAYNVGYNGGDPFGQTGDLHFPLHDFKLSLWYMETSGGRNSEISLINSSFLGFQGGSTIGDNFGTKYLRVISTVPGPSGNTPWTVISNLNSGSQQKRILYSFGERNDTWITFLTESGNNVGTEVRFMTDAGPYFGNPWKIRVRDGGLGGSFFVDNITLRMIADPEPNATIGQEENVNTIEERLDELEQKVAALENRTSSLEAIVQTLQTAFNDFVNKVTNFLFFLPRGFREQMICGNLLSVQNITNSPTNATGFGLYCQISNNACKCTAV